MSNIEIQTIEKYIRLMVRFLWYKIKPQRKTVFPGGRLQSKRTVRLSSHCKADVWTGIERGEGVSPVAGTWWVHAVYPGPWGVHAKYPGTCRVHAKYQGTWGVHAKGRTFLKPLLK